MEMNGYRKVLWIFIALFVVPQSTLAVGDLSNQNPIVVTVILGSEKNDLSFSPDKLTFETGKLYRLILKNSSPQKHYFTSPGFAASVWTRKVQDSSMEVKGAIREIELLPGKSAEWFFVPVKTGTFGLYCHISGHKEAGMVGIIEIK